MIQLKKIITRSKNILFLQPKAGFNLKLADRQTDRHLFHLFKLIHKISIFIRYYTIILKFLIIDALIKNILMNIPLFMNSLTDTNIKFSKTSNKKQSR